MAETYANPVTMFALISRAASSTARAYFIVEGGNHLLTSSEMKGESLNSIPMGEALLYSFSQFKVEPD